LTFCKILAKYKKVLAIVSESILEEREYMMKISHWISPVLLFLPIALWSVEATVQPTIAEVFETPEGFPEVTPIEDLMREHGVLERLLLIYEELDKRLTSNTSFAPKLLHDTAAIVSKFIESYHEKLEEDYLFPRLEKKEEMKELVKTLLEQHQKGRLLTAYIIEHSTADDLQNKETNSIIRECLEKYIMMFRPHIAREDTVAFPFFKTMTSEHEYLFLGDVFENKEKSLFGEKGFVTIVEEVAKIEKALGIYNLNRFTASLPQIAAKASS
jgi:hemerythrin-like domain-containing protein